MKNEEICTRLIPRLSSPAVKVVKHISIFYEVTAILVLMIAVMLLCLQYSMILF